MSFACLVCGAVSPTRYCSAHGNQNQRPNSWQRGYTQTFRENRSRLLEDQPYCCIYGCHQPATIADHDPPRKVLVAAGVKDCDSTRWLRPLCHHHHQQKTQQGR